MGRLAQVRHFVEYAAFAALAAVATALPLDWASAVSGFLWRLIAPRLARQKRALDNLALALPEATFFSAANDGSTIHRRTLAAMVQRESVASPHPCRMGNPFV